MTRFLLFAALGSLLFSCNLYKFNKRCIKDMTNESTKNIKTEILNQVDSVFSNDTLYCSELKRIIKADCMGDSLIEVEVLTKCANASYFYFNKELNFVKVIYHYGIVF